MEKGAPRAYLLIGAALVLVLLVVQIALAENGEPRATEAASQTKQIKSLKRRVAALESKPSVPSPGSLPPSGPAGGGLAGSYPNPQIAPNAIGPAEIADTTRAINLPLTSFVNRSDSTTLDFGPDDGTSPNLLVGGTGTANRLAIAWDDDSDGGGANVADLDLLTTTFIVPPDYASGDGYVLRISKDANASGTSEEFFCQQATNSGFFNDPGGNANDGAVIDTAAMQAYTLQIPITVALVPGDTVNISCRADVFPGVNSADDEVRLHSMEFVYSATE